MNVLITGITGMIGSHFAHATRARGWNVFGVARSSAASRMAAVQDPAVIHCDITDRQSLELVFRRVQPNLVIHMAAQAFNGTSWAMENYTHTANYLGTAYVLQCAREYTPRAKVLLACSSAEYGDVQPADCPLVEDRPLRPLSPYGVSKVGGECLGYQAFKNYGLPVYLPRLFIHVGTGHPPATAIQNFARQLALIATGRSEPIIRVGRLDTARDFIDVRDGVAAMLLLLERGRPGQPVNICTGTAQNIGDTLHTLIAISGAKVEVVDDPALHRPSDEPLLLGDNSRLKALGWTQSYTFRQTLEAVYADWVQRLDKLAP